MKNATTLISWNVNGIRAVLKKNFLEFVKEWEPDILCLQETKAHPEQVDIELSQYPYHYWNSAEKRGYSGTAVFSKIKPIHVQMGIGIPDHDREGRVITLEYDKVYLVNVYTPNSQNELRRLDYRTREWDVTFLDYVKKLETEKPVIFCGDLNVAHREIDLANPKSNTKNAGFTPEERAGFDRIVEAGFIDSFRFFCDEPERYTWWSYRTRARERNIGWRIDYFCVSENLKAHLKRAEILSDIQGSDHCPVFLEVENLF
jgi:exodeoxyribonuclease-3